MPRKSKEDRANCMREYRKRIREASSLDGTALDAKIKEYKEQGLDRNEQFMYMVFHLAMQGKNAKYAELWWRMTKPEPEEAKKYFHEALSIAMDISAVPLALDAIVGLAPLLIEDKGRVLALFSFIAAHPASYVHTKMKAEEFCSNLASQLSGDIVEAAQERGKEIKLEDVVSEVLERKK